MHASNLVDSLMIGSGKGRGGGGDDEDGEVEVLSYLSSI